MSYLAPEWTWMDVHEWAQDDMANLGVGGIGVGGFMSQNQKKLRNLSLALCNYTFLSIVEQKLFTVNIYVHWNTFCCTHWVPGNTLTAFWINPKETEKIDSPVGLRQSQSDTFQEATYLSQPRLYPETQGNALII